MEPSEKAVSQSLTCSVIHVWYCLIDSKMTRYADVDSNRNWKLQWAILSYDLPSFLVELSIEKSFESQIYLFSKPTQRSNVQITWLFTFWIIYTNINQFLEPQPPAWHNFSARIVWILRVTPEKCYSHLLALRLLSVCFALENQEDIGGEGNGLGRDWALLPLLPSRSME